MLPEESIEPQSNELQTNDAAGSPPSTTAPTLGTAGGAVAGAVLGKAVGGRFGAVVGGIAGAVLGHQSAGTLTDFAKEANESLGLGLGADDREVEIPAHYSWEELQALSKPQGS